MWNWRLPWCFRELQPRESFKWYLFNCSAAASFNGVECRDSGHTATINSVHISISADERIKADSISNVVVLMFPEIVLWMVLWCFGRDFRSLSYGRKLT